MLSCYVEVEFVKVEASLTRKVQHVMTVCECVMTQVGTWNGTNLHLWDDAAMLEIDTCVGEYICC